MNGRLIISESGRDRIHELYDERTVIGRGVDADLNLKNPAVASAHCEVKRTATGFKVVDLETTDGTKVNGQLINQQTLQNGDTIQIGEVRITYLGESGAVERPAKKAPPQPLTFHPTDAQGEPHRFYRHEQKRGLGSGPKAALILAALGILALILVWLGRSIPNEEPIGRYRDAVSMLDDEAASARSIEQAIQILENLPPGTVQERDLVHMIETAKGRLFNLVGPVMNQEAQDEFTRIMQYYKSHSEDIGYLQGQVRYFREHYPETGQLVQLEETLEEVLAGGPEGKKKWSEAQQFLRHALKNADFRGAFDALTKLDGDAIMVRAHGPRIATYRNTFERAFKRHFEDMKARALSAHEAGDTERARRIYAQLANVGLEPYSSQAKTLLNSLGG